jgi:uridine kinase
VDRERVLTELAGFVAGRKREGIPLKVAIDGRCAAGKTMLADELGALLRSGGFQVLRPSINGFHHRRERRYRQGEYSARAYYDDAFDYDAVIERALKPLGGNTFSELCRHLSHDLRTDLPADAPPVLVDADAVLLFDGVFLLRSELKQILGSQNTG